MKSKKHLQEFACTGRGTRCRDRIYNGCSIKVAAIKAKKDRIVERNHTLECYKPKAWEHLCSEKG